MHGVLSLYNLHDTHRLSFNIASELGSEISIYEIAESFGIGTSD